MTLTADQIQRIMDIEATCLEDNHNGDGFRCPDCTYDVAQIRDEVTL